MQHKEVIILGIESSCDETSAAILKDGVLYANFIANQKVHQQYGGVVPELASRAHQQHIVPVVDVALKEAGISLTQLSAVAYTQGPGLLGSLLVGASFAKSLALALRIPLIEVNHMQAHILAHFVKFPNEDIPHPSFPFLCLTVSGGHTQIVRVNSPSQMQVIGSTLDDAAGEAFDKTAKLLGLPYPGGPLIDKYAKTGQAERFSFPHPRIDGLDFSFSGLKTSVLYFLQQETKKNPTFIEENLSDICASVQHTIVSILLNKLQLAVQQTGITEVAIAGGVSANSGLQEALKNLALAKQWKVYIPRFSLCTDNAGMVATAGYYKYLDKAFADMHSVPSARLYF